MPTPLLFEVPGDRGERSGARRHRILRSTENSNNVMIDLESESSSVETVHAALLDVWPRAEPEGLMSNPQARIVEIRSTDR